MFWVAKSKYCTFWTVVHLPFHWAIISNRFEPEPSCLSLKRHHISFTQFVIGMNTISYNRCIIIYTIQTSTIQYLYNVYNISLRQMNIYISHDLMIPLSHVFSISYIAVSHTSHYLTVSYVYHVSQYRMYLSILSILVFYVRI